MADAKISALGAYTTPIATDVLPIVDVTNGITKKITYSSLFSLLPTGVISPYGGSSAPTGWLLCNGATVSQATYALLFAITGHTYGADPGGGNFILPDLRGRVPVGKSSDTEFDVLGETGGEKTHTLTTAEMPAHTHTIHYGGNSGSTYFTHNTQAPGGGDDTTQSTGGDGAHNNLQPYITLNYIIKY